MAAEEENSKKFRLVLLGGGHTNTQVIKHIRPNDERIPESLRNNIELILVSDFDNSLYSGMCPGGVATLYNENEFSVELCKLIFYIFPSFLETFQIFHKIHECFHTNLFFVHIQYLYDCNFCIFLFFYYFSLKTHNFFVKLQ